MSKKITSFLTAVAFLTIPLIASAQTFTIPQLPPNPTIADLQNEIAQLTQIVTQLIAAHLHLNTGGTGGSPFSSNPTSSSSINTTGTVNANGSFTATPFSGLAPLVVTLSGSVPGTSYTLDFGDGSVPINGNTNSQCPANNQNCGASTSTISVQHTYTVAGQYRPIITAGSLTFSAAINVIGTSTLNTSSSTLKATPTSGAAPLSVAFTGTAAGASYWIDYGDSSFTSGAIADPTCPSSTPNCTTTVNASHTYNFGGTYTATLYRPVLSCANILFGCGGGLGLATTTITVSGSAAPTVIPNGTVTIPTPWAPNPSNPGSLEAQTYWHNFEIGQGEYTLTNSSGTICSFGTTPVGGTCGNLTHEMTGIGSDYWVSN